MEWKQYCKCGNESVCCRGNRGPRGRNGRPGPPGPQGERGPAGGLDQFLGAYSTPPQSGGDGTSLVFDRNGSVNGTAITHASNSSDITLSEPGYYYVSFQSSVTPGVNAQLPESVRLYLADNGAEVPGASAVHTFTGQGTTATMAFSVILPVTDTPVTLQVKGQGGNFFYSETGISVIKLQNSESEE